VVCQVVSNHILFSSGDFGAQVSKLLDAVNPDRLVSRGEAFTNQLARSISALDIANKARKKGTPELVMDYANYGSFTRLRPQDNGKDSVEEFAWVPPCFQDMHISFDQVRTCGCPWLSVCVPGLFRGGISGIPLNGVGQFVMASSGSTVAIVWPFLTFTALDIWPDDAPQFLRRQTTANAAEIIGKASWTVLHSGNLLWVPYGSCIMMVALSQSARHVAVVSQPLISTRLVNKLVKYNKDILLNSLANWFQSVGGSRGRFNASYGPLVSWLEECGAVMDQAADEDGDDNDVEPGTQRGTPHFGNSSAGSVVDASDSLAPPPVVVPLSPESPPLEEEGLEKVLEGLVDAALAEEDVAPAVAAGPDEPPVDADTLGSGVALAEESATMGDSPTGASL
jgi:hypothetical protein